MGRGKGSTKHGKHHLPKKVRGKWHRSFNKLRKRLEQHKKGRSE